MEELTNVGIRLFITFSQLTNPELCGEFIGNEDKLPVFMSQKSIKDIVKSYLNFNHEIIDIQDMVSVFYKNILLKNCLVYIKPQENITKDLIDCSKIKEELKFLMCDNDILIKSQNYEGQIINLEN